MDGFDFKGMLSLKVSYGKKIVTVAYYAALIVAAFAMLANIVGVFVMCFSGVAAGILSGVWKIITAPFLLAFEVIIIRLLAELVNAVFDIRDK